MYRNVCSTSTMFLKLRQIPISARHRSAFTRKTHGNAATLHHVPLLKHRLSVSSINRDLFGSNLVNSSRNRRVCAKILVPLIQPKSSTQSQQNTAVKAVQDGPSGPCLLDPKGPPGLPTLQLGFARENPVTSTGATATCPTVAMEV